MKRKINLSMLVVSIISILSGAGVVLALLKLSAPLLTSLPVIIAIIIVLAAITSVISAKLTDTIIKPIENVAKNIDDLEGVPVYKELTPFVNTIKKQHEDILSNADMRQEFTANVSHELKTPLTAISGYAEIISSGEADSEQTVHFAKQIKSSSDCLMNLINDIIKLSELDSSQTQMKFENFDLYELCCETVDEMQVNADRENVLLTADGNSCTVCADRSMIKEVICNLIDNAIRYNYKGGSIKVTAVRIAGGTLLSVQDTGIGISDADKDRIFERFYRVDKSRSKQTGGTGLGLAIVKHIVSQHNATMTLESKLGHGTEIRITFPN